ncbi:MAG: hypothetical protein J6S60_09740, partial [Oscillospiraceae bacterium]|nr:hypothetical protein [Oscillospiraceae bacterium]
MRPVLMTMLISMKHSWPTDLARLFNSPGLYFRKNVAGSDKRRIIMEACTPREVLVFSLPWTRFFTLLINCEERDT